MSNCYSIIPKLLIVIIVFLAAVLICALPRMFRLYDNAKKANYPGKKYQHDHFTVLQLEGSWYQMGKQYGSLMKDELRQVLEYADRQGTAETDSYLFPYGLPCGLRRLDQLFQGMADGSGLTLAQLVRINSVELAYLDASLSEVGESVKGQCSCLGIFGKKTTEGQVFCARNYDWLASFAHLEPVLTCFKPNDGSQALEIVNYPGCLYLTTAMNESGLFLVLNSGAYASAETSSDGYHNVWLLWELMQQCRDVDSAVHMLESLKGQGYYVINLADEKKFSIVEWALNSATTITPSDEQAFEVSANHFIQPGWQNLPGAAEGGEESSLARREALRRLASEIPDGTCGLPEIQRIFDVPASQGGAKCSCTLFQVIAAPAQGLLQIRGHNSETWQTVRFGEIMKRN